MVLPSPRVPSGRLLGETYDVLQVMEGLVADLSLDVEMGQ
jgi:hypothetical protein